MSINITEVQITFVISMGLITLFLAIILPKYVNLERKISISKKLLTHSTLLITIHFFVQYTLQKSVDDVAGIRTIVNLFFGIPISYFFNLSYLYLLRNGKIFRYEWWIAPIALTLSIIVFSTNYSWNSFPNKFTNATYIISLIYGVTLTYYIYIFLHTYRQVKQEVGDNANHPLMFLLNWTKWSQCILVFTALGYPIMTFCTNYLARSIYGILSISSCLIYILSFVGYCLAYSVRFKEKQNQDLTHCGETTHNLPCQELTEQMTNAVKHFIESDYYTTSGITIKDAAIQMGISCNRLRLWLRSTEYEKFSNWIVYLRIEKSKEFLLKYPTLNNQEIAEKCGFCDRQYFQLQFSKLEGISPSKWIKEHQEEIEKETFAAN